MTHPHPGVREALEFAAQHLSSDWPERCQEIVRRARAALAAPLEQQAEAADDELCVEVWKGDRKVTVYPGSTVLRVWGSTLEEISEEPTSLKSVQDAMDWLYAAQATPLSVEPVTQATPDDEAEFTGGNFDRRTDVAGLLRAALSVEPAAWIGPVGQTMPHEIYVAWSAQYPNDAKHFRPLYASPPPVAESADALDAKRYRWLRDTGAAFTVRAMGNDGRMSMVYPIGRPCEGLDIAIDAAIAAAPAGADALEKNP